ncbi:PKD domain-containing protein [Colwelliaceae bacterium MEBiC 14330]
MYTFYPLVALIKVVSLVFLVLFISACGGGSVNSAEEPPVSEEPPVLEEPSSSVTKAPINQITHAYFRDQDAGVDQLSGNVVIEALEVIEDDPAKIESLWLYWANSAGEKQGEAWLKTEATDVYLVEIPAKTNIPENISGFLLYANNAIGQAEQGHYISFHDFTGNAAMSGYGGNEIASWQYGIDRPTIPIQRTTEQGGTCLFDNGLVSVINMNNTIDQIWEDNSGNNWQNQANDDLFKPYSFACEQMPTHNSDIIEDDIGVWTYSTLNDAMFYGTLVYDSFVKYLGEPPLDEKIRLRVHYGNKVADPAYWDGAYANFGDAYGLYYSTASLDAIAHEVAHGVLNRISALNIYQHELSLDARTIHEAFGDISAVMAKYEFTGHTDNWIHGEESHGPTRHLDQIKTDSGAIASFLDYDDAGDNFYQRIGMISYPFYLLSNQWGLAKTYQVYLASARACWHPQTTLTEAAQCIKEQAILAGLSADDVIEAFKIVKIQLFDEGTLSHFTVEQFKLRTQFFENSVSTNQVTQWLWDFGDGNTSTAQSPEHTYAQAGSYQVTLSVIDQSNDQDTFSRFLKVTDQYCPISTSLGNDTITEVSFDGDKLAYNPSEYDYTQDVIDLSSSDKIVVNIEGESLATEKSNHWRIWIDFNDNGIFGDTSEELLIDKYVAEGLPYGVNTAIDLSNIPFSGEPKYMRIIGDFFFMSACFGKTGEALDLRVTW